MNTSFKSILQYCVPQKLLSRLIGYLADFEGEWFKNKFIDWFIERYQVDMSEAEQADPHAYITFNHFFTRALKVDARPFDQDRNVFVSPADGCLSELGAINQGQLLQAKGHQYSLLSLLGGNQVLADQFVDGTFITVYLSPRDYHRVHMPCDGTLKKMIHVPGELFSVNQQTAIDVPELFARNERVICVFDTEFGPLAMIMVGAMIVASIATVWHGQVTPIRHQVQVWDYQPQQAPIMLAKGAEMGRFYLGSTVIMLLPHQVLELEEKWLAGIPIKLGQALGKLG